MLFVERSVTNPVLLSMASVAATEWDGPMVGRLDAYTATGAGHPDVRRFRGRWTATGAARQGSDPSEVRRVPRRVRPGPPRG
jgi:hypothetical protein